MLLFPLYFQVGCPVFYRLPWTTHPSRYQSSHLRLRDVFPYYASFNISSILRHCSLICAFISAGSSPSLRLSTSSILASLLPLPAPDRRSNRHMGAFSTSTLSQRISLCLPVRRSVPHLAVRHQPHNGQA